MPWKLIFAILIIAVMVTLIGFNWGFTSNVSLGVYEFADVPIIITIGISFLAGSLFAIPYTIRTTLRVKKRQGEKMNRKLGEKNNDESTKRRTDRKGSRKKKPDTAAPLPDTIAEDNSRIP